MKYFIVPFLLIIFCVNASAQNKEFTRQDTLRGSLTPERVWWDLKHYDLNIKADPSTKSLKGVNKVKYEVLTNHNVMQIDLQDPMIITSVTQKKENLVVRKEGNAYFIFLKTKQVVGDINEISIYFEGQPKISKRPPWDGGLTWEKDENGLDFIATSCQGEGASLWWPCKDHMYDEPENMAINITTPSHLMNVSNGRLVKTTDHQDGTTTYHWYVENPINNYGVNMNIGDYTLFTEKYQGEKGELDCYYYVLKDHLAIAKEHFKDAKKTLQAFEHWFGPYPFYEDSFKLVEVPYLGMEHQSSVTYGNQFKKGYLGRDVSGTGWGLKFDFIIVHESGHEWFANNITYKDIADMWIHESFTAYSESLFLDFHYGKEAGNTYVVGTRKNIRNKAPIIGTYDVNHSGSGDMYSKGANMLHTLRQLLEDDELWRKILRGLNDEFYHQTVTTEQVENYMSKMTKIDLSAFFNQYLRDIRIPTIEYRIENDQLSFRYIDIVADFDMPVIAYLGEEKKWIFPTKEWKKLPVSSGTDSFKIDQNFYVNSSRIDNSK